jgi:prepilin signal peptidase PulO-like enzyme (type II secretory pathway)
MTLDLTMGIFVWLLGLCVGSFLNVVIYRWPRDLSIARPARSFCPRCGALIAWYDNIPVLSWLMLRGRCRRCREPISVQYPLVEAATGLTFVLLYYLLFIAGARVWADHLHQPVDWPLLGAWLVLAAAMIACAAMDVAWYMVDIRITNVAIVAGLVLYAIWPADHVFVPAGTSPVGAAALVALILGGITAWLANRHPQAAESSTDQQPQSPQNAAESGHRAESAVGALATLLLLVLAAWAFSEIALHRHPHAVYAAPLDNPAAWGTANRALGGLAPDLLAPCTLLVLFMVLVLVGGQPRGADAEVEQALDEERPQARRQVLGELAWLAAPVLAGLATLAALTHYPALDKAWHAAAAWTPGAGIQPLGGLGYSAFGLVVGAAAGWTLRIVFTLIFGREALGSGDIYILAAAGATAGWDIVLVGLLLAVGIALAGYAISLLLKRTLTIPFGPWLALGFVAALWLNQRAAVLAQEYYDAIAYAWIHQSSICWLGAGLMLIGSAGAIAAARLVRRALEAQD